MGKEFKPLTVSDFGLSPNDMKILVLGSQIFAGPREAEPEPEPAPTPAKDEHARHQS